MEDKNKTYVNDISDTIQIKARNTILSLDEFPKYDLFLSQVIEFIQDIFHDETYTINIIQNYIKSEVIAKPTQGKKKGYTKFHLIQLVFVSYMRPVLSTDEIKKVFSLAFNEINNREDDIISWETAYQIFYEIQKEQMNESENTVLNEAKLRGIVDALEIKQDDKERIYTFITVLALIAKASFIKNAAKELISKY
jgi:hypothetical protein